MKKYFVSELRENTKVDDIFLVTAKSIQTTRSGADFIKFKFTDKTGSIDGFRWQAQSFELDKGNIGEYVAVKGTIQLYQGSLQLVVDSFQPFNDRIDHKDFIKSSEKDSNKLMNEILEIIDKVKDTQIKKLLNYFFDDDDFRYRFSEAPAAQTIHQAFLGGLLEHTLNVVKICINIAPVYPEIDKDMLVAGAILHDIGKIDELMWDTHIAYTTEGQLIGHLVGGAAMIKEATANIDGFDIEKSLLIQHMILSHHGQYEYGSPKLPMFVEAEILHHADDIDAKHSIFTDAIVDSNNKGEPGTFTNRHFLLLRNIYKGNSRANNRSDSLFSVDELTVDTNSSWDKE